MNRSFLGTALRVPLQLKDGAAVTISDRAVVEQGITTLLNISKGTMFFLPEYGSRLKELLFEPNDLVLQDLIRRFVFEAMRDWEKRAEFVDIDFEFISEQPELLHCDIKYRLLQSNEINSFIYPFYRKLIN